MERFLYLTSTLQSCRAALGDSFHPRTDAELCLLRLCDESLCGDVSALSARIERLEEMLKNGVVPAKAAPAKVAAPAPKPAAKARTAPIEEERPPLPEEPPMMDESDRVFDIPTSPPVSQAPAKKAEVPTNAGGDTALWAQLINDYKGRLPVNHRVFLNMAKGVLDGDVLTVYCNNDFVKDSLNNESVLSVLREVTSKAAGCNVRVVLAVGAVKAAAKPKAAAPIEKAPSKLAVTEAPPWEDPTPPSTQDRLDELEKSGSRLDHFKIK